MPTEEMSLARDIPVPIDCGTNLADILSNALPPDKRSHDKDKTLSDSSVSFFPDTTFSLSQNQYFFIFNFTLFKIIFSKIYFMFLKLGNNFFKF